MVTPEARKEALRRAYYFSNRSKSLFTSLGQTLSPATYTGKKNIHRSNKALIWINSLEAYESVNLLLVYSAMSLKQCIREKGYSLPKFEKYCKENGYGFNRRSLNGLISGDRCNFKLTYFSIPFYLLGIDYNEVLIAYVQNVLIPERSKEGKEQPLEPPL